MRLKTIVTTLGIGILIGWQSADAAKMLRAKGSLVEVTEHSFKIKSGSDLTEFEKADAQMTKDLRVGDSVSVWFEMGDDHERISRRIAKSVNPKGQAGQAAPQKQRLDDRAFYNA